MIKRIRYPFFFCLISISLLFTFSCKNSSTATEESTDVKTPVTICPVSYKKVISTVDLPAVSTFMNKSIIRATTTGRIERIFFVQGDQVKGNQKLFTIRTRESMALQNNMQGDSSLYFKGLINILSPKSGVINSISYQKGDFVQEGDELAVISEQESLVFILEVPFELEDVAEKNKKIRIELPDRKILNGTISGRLPEMNIQNQTIKYVIHLNSSEKLPENLIANVILVKSSTDNAMVLPKNAVLSNETQTEFWVMKLLNDSIAIKVPVDKGFENDEEIEITGSDLIPSDRIILTGNYGLPDTAKIYIQQE